MKRSHLTLCIAAALCGGGYLAHAADTYTLNEVIVTATRLEESTQRVPASVEVITAQDMSRRPVQNLADALAHTVGVYRSPVADGGMSSDLLMRGFGTDNILIMLDGQPLNTGWNGTVNWAELPTTGIERIEVVKGAGSSLYGGRAVGGVINIITAKSAAPFSGTAIVSYGSENTKRLSLQTDVHEGPYRVGIGYEKRSTDGFRGFFVEKSAPTKPSKKKATHQVNLPQSARDRYIIGGRGDKRNHSEIWNLHIGYDFNADRSLDYRFTRTEYNYNYHSPFSLVYDKDGNQVFSGDWQLPNKDIISVSPDDFIGYHGFYRMAIHRLQYADRAHQIYAHLGYTNRDKDGYSSAESYPNNPTSAALDAWNGEGTYSLYPSKSYDFDLHKNWDFERHTLTAGYNYRQESFAQTRFTMDHWQDLAIDTGRTPYEYNGGKGITHALYLQDKYAVNDDTSLYLGLRYDRYTKKEGYNTILKNGKISKDNRFGEGTYHEISPKVAIEHRLSDTDSVFASYGHSFNPPILYQVYRKSARISANPDLKPETTDTFELGYKHTDENLGWNITMFHAKTKDLVRLDTRNNVRAYYNWDDDIVRRGIELGANYHFTDNWSSYANYTLTDAKSDGKRYYDIPRHIVHFGVQYDAKPWQVLLDNTYVSKRQAPDVNTGEYKSEDAYFLTNLSVNYELRDGLVLQGAVYNLFNRQFYAGEAARERNYNVSLQYNF